VLISLLKSLIKTEEVRWHPTLWTLRTTKEIVLWRRRLQ